MKALLGLALAILAAFLITGCGAGDEDRGQLPPPPAKPNLDDPNMPPQARERIEAANKIAEANAKAAKPNK